MGKLDTIFPRRDAQTYRILALVAVCGEIPAELTYRFASSPSFKKIFIRGQGDARISQVMPEKQKSKKNT